MDNFKEGTRDLAEKLPKLLLTVLSRLSAAAIRLSRRKPLRWQIKFLISLQAAVPSLEFLEGKTLPAIAALQERTK